MVLECFILFGLYFASVLKLFFYLHFHGLVLGEKKEKRKEKESSVMGERGFPPNGANLDAGATAFSCSDPCYQQINVTTNTFDLDMHVDAMNIVDFISVFWGGSDQVALRSYT